MQSGRKRMEIAGNRTVTAVARGVALFGVAVLGQLVAIVMLAAMVLSFGLGLIFLFPPAVRLTRAMAGLSRRLAREWSGVQIDEPYRPAPPPPVPQSDGWYREGRSLYKTPRWPAFNRRMNWMMTDPATWRDLGYLLSGVWSGGLIAAAPVLLVVLGLAAGEIAWGGGLGLLWLGLALLALVTAPWVAPWGVRVHGGIAHALLAPTEKARLER